MREFESHLVEAIEPDSHGVLAAALTESGERKWFLYVVDDLDETSARINGIPQKEEPYPIEIARTPDPNWALLSNLISAID